MPAGLNVFAQDLSEDMEAYCYPPICLLAPLLCYLCHGHISCDALADELVTSFTYICIKYPGGT